MALRIRTDRTLVRAGSHSVRYALATVAAPSAPPRSGRLPVQIALVLDRSGSMAGQKIVMARRAAVQAIRSLRDEDRFSLVIYDDVVEVLFPATPASAEASAQAACLLESVQPRGSTDLCAGWLRGCEQVGESLADDAVGRALLLTDGLANRGITDRSEILRHAAELRRRRVSTTTFGVGADFDDALLRRMAEAGGGNFYFIEDAAQIPDFVASETGEVLEVVARDARLVVEAGAGVEVESLNGFPAHRDDGAFQFALGSLVSRQLLDAVLRLRFRRGAVGETESVRLRLEDPDGALAGAGAELAFSYAGHSENDAQPRDRVVDRAVARLYAARAEQVAVERNRAADYEGARRVLLDCARRVREYAGQDPELLALVAQLEHKPQELGSDIGEMSRKSRFAATSYELKDKMARGSSRRGPVH